MRILLINQAFVSPDEPGHTRHFEMAKFLQARGHELVIVASDLNYQTGQRTVARTGFRQAKFRRGAGVALVYLPRPAPQLRLAHRVVLQFYVQLGVDRATGPRGGPGDGHNAADLSGGVGMVRGVDAAQAVPARSA